MKETIYKLMLFLSPIILISLFVFMVDPYNLFDISHLFTDEAKIKCIYRTDATTPRGSILWKTIDFKRNPTPNILLGNSRTAEISSLYLGNRIGGKTTNFAFPGGNLKTIIDLFWMASRSTNLENVIIQTDFNTYNLESSIDLYGPIQKVIDEPWSYFFSWNYLNDTFSVFYYSITKNEQYVSRSYIHRKSNWELTEDYLRNGIALKYSYPKQLYDELTQISKFCQEEKINLIFVIAPNYFEVYNYIKSHNLEDENNRFKTDLKALGTTIDLDYEHPFSLNRNNYSDHFHIRSHLADSMVSMIFQSDLID